MNLSEQLIQVLRDRMEHYHFSKADLARESGVSEANIGRIMNRTLARRVNAITEDTAEKLSKALNLPLDEMFRLSTGKPAASKSTAGSADRSGRDIYDEMLDYLRAEGKIDVLEAFARGLGWNEEMIDKHHSKTGQGRA